MRRLFVAFGVLCVSFLSFSGVFGYGFEDAIKPPYGDGFPQTGALPVDGNEATDVGKQFKKVSVEDNKGALQKIMEVFKLKKYIKKSEGQTATFYVKEISNWALSIIGLVALVLLIYGFYKMFFAKDHEEGFESAKKIIINAVIALLLISLSWFLINWFFTIYAIVSEKSNIEGQ